MPRNVRWFAWLWAISCLTLVPEVLLMPPLDAAASRAGITRPVELAATAGMGILIILVQLPFFWLAVWKRRNWARWLLFVLFVTSVLSLFVTPHAFDQNFLPMATVAFAGTLVEVVAFYFSFTGDARPWFRPENPN